ncbi:MAG: nucleoside hydrolase [Lachnospiraceae bacterium]|jgi:pyrimidine-specific ribonucleoside hydrolase|nr:nucleoside hydrolase [Lachnospiraceae bacterium]
MRKIPVIIDCDPGHDDMVALILALGSPFLDVKLITNVAGNKVINKVTNNTLNILNYCGADVEVAAGARQPLVRGYQRTDTEGAHGLSGLDGFVFPGDNPLRVSKRTALEAAADILKHSREKVTFICTGPLSNMGLLIRAYPDLCSEKIEQISLMGGTCHFILTKPFMEFNTYFDAEASKIVFESGIPVVMYGYDVTYKSLFQEDFLYKLEEIGNQTGHMMAELLRKFMELHNQVWLDLGGCPVHDACAVAGVIDRSVIRKSEKMYVQIMTEPGPLSGATVCDYEHRSGKPENVEVVFELDLEKFLCMILESAGRLV